MARRMPEQLSLSMSLPESVALRERLARTEERLTETHEELVLLREEAAQWADHRARLDRERYALLQDRDAARRDVADLQFQVRATQFLLELQSTDIKATPAGIPAWLPQELRKLLALSHPDRWSQGQPAEALAHEVASALNGLRQRLGEVH